MGFDAWSCDLQENRNPNAKHYQGNVFDIIDDNWDAMIAFPPCTHLAVSGATHFEQKRKDGRQQQGIDFFMAMINAPIEKIAVENPIGIMSNVYRLPDQIIQPYYFGDPFQKSTCLWLKGLQPLIATDVVDKGEFKEWIDKNGKKKRQATWYAETWGKGDLRWKIRSQTFPGIAKAMADQWSGPQLIQTKLF